MHDHIFLSVLHEFQVYVCLTVSVSPRNAVEGQPGSFKNVFRNPFDAVFTMPVKSMYVPLSSKAFVVCREAK